MTWVVWFALCFGLVYLIVGAAITQRPRRWLYGKLGGRWGGWLACAPCCAFWVGVGVGVPDLLFLVPCLPAAFISSSIGVAVTAHLAGGFVVMGGVVALQAATQFAFAEIAREQAEKLDG